MEELGRMWRERTEGSGDEVQKKWVVVAGRREEEFEWGADWKDGRWCLVLRCS